MAGTSLLVGVSGGTASGKTSLCQKIFQEIAIGCTVVPMDNFYKGLDSSERENVEEYNFDHPNALDFEEMYICISTLLNGEDAEIPIYDFKTHSRAEETVTLKTSKLILFEGIHALHDTRIRELMSLKIFVQTDDDVRLGRRLLRDTNQRGRTINGVLEQYFKFVKPSYDEFIRPNMKYADIIVPRGAHNIVAVAMIVSNLKQHLDN